MNNPCIRRALLAFALATGAQQAAAVVVYQSTFDTPAANLAQVTALYGLTPSQGLSNASVAGGMLVLQPDGGQRSLLLGAFSGDLTISFTAGMMGSPGGTNVGLRIGDNNLIFFPTTFDGAFRIDGPGGHGSVGLPFFPANGTQMGVSINASTGVVGVAISDAFSNIYFETFVDANYVAGVTEIGLSVGGSEPGQFDNLVLSSTVAAVPEPGAWALMLAGLGVLVGVRKPVAPRQPPRLAHPHARKRQRPPGFRLRALPSGVQPRFRPPRPSTPPPAAAGSTRRRVRSAWWRTGGA